MRLKIYQSLLERKHCVRSLSKNSVFLNPPFQHRKAAKDAGLVHGRNTAIIHYLPTTGCCRLPLPRAV